MNQAGGSEPAKDKADHREQAHGRREGAPLRHGGVADDACARGVQGLLLLGLARALEERLIDVAAGFDLAFEFAQAHRGLAHLDALALLGFQRLVQRGFVVAGAGQVVLRGLREALDFFVDGAAQVLRPAVPSGAAPDGAAPVRSAIRPGVSALRHIARADWRWSATAAPRGWRRRRSMPCGWLRSGRTWPARRASAPAPRRAAGCWRRAAGR